MICCIPTKGRPETKTFQLFNNVGIETYHFIEPKEMHLYNVPNKISILKDNMGLAYSRNFILDYCKTNLQDWAIICDDDVTQFGIYNGKTVKKDASIWFEIIEKAKKLPFEIVCISYRQHAWMHSSLYSINKNTAEVCILINISKINIRYSGNYPLKEDRHFSMLCVQNGNGVLRLNRYWFGCPNVGSNIGGLHNNYKNKIDEDSAIKLVKYWHPYAKLKKQGGRVDIKLSMKELAIKLNKIVK